MLRWAILKDIFCRSKIKIRTLNLSICIYGKSEGSDKEILLGSFKRLFKGINYF